MALTNAEKQARWRERQRKRIAELEKLAGKVKEAENIDFLVNHVIKTAIHRARAWGISRRDVLQAIINKIEAEARKP